MPAPVAQTDTTRLTALQIKVLHLLLKPVGDFTSHKTLGRLLADPKTGEPPDQLPEAVFALYDQKPPLLFESQDLKQHYALTDAGRRLERTLPPFKTQPAQDDEEPGEAGNEAPRPRGPQKPAKAKGGQAKKPNQKPSKTPTPVSVAPAAQTEPSDDAGDA